MIDTSLPPLSPSFFYINPLIHFSIPTLSPISNIFIQYTLFLSLENHPLPVTLQVLILIEKMTVEKEDLGLSLSLNFPQSNRSSLQLNLMPSFPSYPPSSSSSPSPPFTAQKTSWIDNFPSFDRNADACSRGEMRSFLRGIDVNRLPSTAADGEEEAGVSSPISTVSSVSGKRSERDQGNGDENEIERSSSRGISDEEDGDAARKKLRLSKDQSAVLEESFKEHNTLNPKQKLALAKRLGLRPRQVEVWFQNRRARTKLKQTEVDCEFLKRCCENLTEENRRLQKEVQELRALKLSPQFYMQMTPPTTLTMCPSCERVAAPPPSSAQSMQPVDRTHPHPMGHVLPRPISINPWATSGPSHTGRSMIPSLDRSNLVGPRA